MFGNYSCHKYNRRTCVAMSSPLLTRRVTSSMHERIIYF